jgi:hypothetical protein
MQAIRTVLAVTSIPPAAAQSTVRRSATDTIIESWAGNGFPAGSVNPSGEIEELKTAFPSVAFHATRCERARLFSDRYGPCLGDIFDLCRDADISALINSDIYLMKGGVLREIAANSETFYAARRTDIAHVGGASLGVYRRGVDAVFFDPRRYAALLDDAEIRRLQLGAPFWDIVVPVVASFHGDVRFIRPPIIAHVIHTPQWSQNDYERLRAFAARATLNHALANAESSERATAFARIAHELVAQPRKMSSQREVKSIARLIDAWLRRLESTCEVSISLDEQDQVFKGIADSIDGDMLQLANQESSGGSTPRRDRGFLRHVRASLRRRRRNRDDQRWERLLANIPPAPKS